MPICFKQYLLQSLSAPAMHINTDHSRTVITRACSATRPNMHILVCMQTCLPASGAQVCVMILINALVSSPDELDFRLHLRNEFMRDGLMDILEVGRAPAI